MKRRGCNNFSGLDKRWKFTNKSGFVDISRILTSYLDAVRNAEKLKNEATQLRGDKNKKLHNSPKKTRQKKDYCGVRQRLLKIESITGTSNTTSVQVKMPSSLSSSITGKVFTFFCAMSRAVSSTVADLPMVNNGKDIICLAVKALARQALDHPFRQDIMDCDYAYWSFASNNHN